jgi:hypothetical protein
MGPRSPKEGKKLQALDRLIEEITVDAYGDDEQLWASRLLSTLCLCRAGYDFKRLFTISEY